MCLTLAKKYLPYQHWEIRNVETDDSLKIVPDRGGLITSWICNDREMLYFDEPRFKDASKSVRGGIPILFPICGDLPGDKYNLKNKEYYIKQHGFARDSCWQINLTDTKKSIILQLNQNKSTLISYPFEFNLEMEISLIKNSLQVLTRVKNNSKIIMPFSFGLHPYFLVKDLSKVIIKGLHGQCINHQDMSSSNTNSQLNNLSKGVDFISDSIGSTTTTLVDNANNISIELKAEDPFNFVVIWTDPPRDMICLEPWTSPRNSFINGNKIVLLSPGEIKRIKCSFLIN
ncbi:galactose mutarotase [Prochlorococcus marinus]|uniref:aldose epimerase family protein n=1 Tax=Prochlorococcus marinus TaxID=1219 RepID=UPI0022B43A98|nr:galactose mutarotase [Prochlorococcus marinus]